MKTSYYPIANTTGGIAISRYSPTGWTGLRYPDLAPSADLLNGFKQKHYTIEEYNKIYYQQMVRLDSKRFWSDLALFESLLLTGLAQTAGLNCFEIVA